jgi:hypothetical protein
VRRLKDALDEACQLRTEPVAPQQIQREAQVEIEVKQVQFGGSERIGVPYRVHPLKAAFNPYVRIALSKYPYSTVERNEFHFQENRILQSRLLEELVREEGPIHFDYAVQRLAATWDVHRIGPKVTSAMREALDMLLKDQRLTVKGDFLWPNDLIDVPVRVPVLVVAESQRPPEHVPPEEIENAMKLITQYALSISPESLIAETAHIFGFTHVTEKTKERLREVYNKMLRERKLINSNDAVILP